MLRENNPTNETYRKINEWLSIVHSSSASLKEKDRARTLIVTNMYPVVRNIAKTIARRANDPIEDLTQAGFIGLLKAIDNYDINLNDNFRVYAGYLIIGEIKHYIRDRMNTIKIPRHIQELSIRINGFIETLTDDEVKSITSKKIAKALALKEHVVNIALEADRRKDVLYLEEAFRTNSTNKTYEEVIGDHRYEEKAEYEDIRIVFDEIIDKLPAEYKVLIDLFYKQDYTRKEIAEALVLTEMAVNRRLKRAFELIADLVVEKNNKKEGSYNGILH